MASGTKGKHLAKGQDFSPRAPGPTTAIPGSQGAGGRWGAGHLGFRPGQPALLGKRSLTQTPGLWVGERCTQRGWAWAGYHRGGGRDQAAAVPADGGTKTKFLPSPRQPARRWQAGFHLGSVAVPFCAPLSVLLRLLFSLSLSLFLFLSLSVSGCLSPCASLLDSLSVCTAPPFLTFPDSSECLPGPTSLSPPASHTLILAMGLSICPLPCPSAPVAGGAS